MKDVLNDKSLRTMPYDIPEGYFEGLQESLTSKAAGSHTRRWPVYMAAAAAFALLVAVGRFFLGDGSGTDFTQEDYIVFSDEMASSILHESYDVYADAITEDDIIEYLIYMDTELDELY